MRLLSALFFAFFVAIGQTSVAAAFLPPVAVAGAPLVNLASAASGVYSSLALYNVGAGAALNVVVTAAPPGPFNFNFVNLTSTQGLSTARFSLNAAACSGSSCAAAGAALSPLSTQLFQVRGSASRCDQVSAAMLQNWGGGDAVGTTIAAYCSPTSHIGINEAYYFVPVAIDSDNTVYQIRSWQHQRCISIPSGSGVGSTFSPQLSQCSTIDTTQQWALYGYTA